MHPQASRLGEPAGNAHPEQLAELNALRTARIKLGVFAALTLVAVLVDLPIWSQLALLATTMMIPLAVALQADPRLVRFLLPAAATTRTRRGAPAAQPETRVTR